MVWNFLKQTTIYSVFEYIDRIKQKKYYNTTENKMIQDLIILGIEVMKKEMVSEKRVVSSDL
ncbi:hypothetical protein D7V86_25450 [bacterium D16-51]|nr:hypothetical protein D7V96_26050 [bacterium D16-59]RKI53038.1 hypothetical protein D7V86_25450 [bacterium D16-51]